MEEDLHPEYFIKMGNSESCVFGTDNEVINSQNDTRNSQTIMSFYMGKRQFGQLALNKTCTNEKQTAYSFPSSLMYSDPERKNPIILSFEATKTDKVNKEFNLEPLECFTYYLDWLIPPNREKPKEICLVIPKYFDDFARQRIIESSEISGIKIIPIASTTAQFVDYIARSDFNDIETVDDTQILIVSSGQTSTELAYWNFNKKDGKFDATLLQYDYVDIGGQDLTNAIANKYLVEFSTNEEYPEETRNFCKQKLEDGDKSFLRIFYNEADRIKSAIGRNAGGCFDCMAISAHELKTNVQETDLYGAEDAQLCQEVLKQFLLQSKQKFEEKYQDTYPLSNFYHYEKNGGNTSSHMLSDLLHSTFFEDEEDKFFSVLPIKESEAEGASFYYTSYFNNMTFHDNISPYTYSIENNKLISNQNDQVIYQYTPFEEEKPDVQRYIKKQPLRKTVELYTLKEGFLLPSQEELKFDNFGKVDIESEYIEADLIKSTPEEMKNYETNRQDLYDIDTLVLRIANDKNNFHSLILNIGSKFKRIDIFKDSTKELNEIKKNYQSIYADSIEDNENIGVLDLIETNTQKLIEDVWPVIRNRLQELKDNESNGDNAQLIKMTQTIHFRIPNYLVKDEFYPYYYGKPRIEVYNKENEENQIKTIRENAQRYTDMNDLA